MENSDLSYEVGGRVESNSDGLDLDTSDIYSGGDSGGDSERDYAGAVTISSPQSGGYSPQSSRA